MRSQYVADAEHGAALLLGNTHCLDRIGGFAGLRHRNHQRGRIDDRVAIAKFAGEFGFDRQTDQRTQQVHANQTGGVRGTAAGYGDFADLPEMVFGDGAEFAAKMYVAGIVDAARQRFFDHRRLLEDFFEHEVLVAALFGRRCIPRYEDRLAFDRAAVVSGNLVAVAADDRDLAFLQDDFFARVRQDGRRIRRDVHFSVADADHQRAGAIAREYQVLGVVAGDHSQRIRSAHFM